VRASSTADAPVNSARGVDVRRPLPAVSHGEPDTRSGVCNGPRRSCAATTCVRDPARAAGRDDRPARSTEPARGYPQAAADSSRADGKKVRNFFSCVTTRSPSAVRRVAEVHGASSPRTPDAVAAVAAARQPPVAHAPRRADDVAAVAGRSANGGPPSSTPDPDNTADSNGVAGRPGGSLHADKHAAAVAACWRKRAGQS